MRIATCLYNINKKALINYKRQDIISKQPQNCLKHEQKDSYKLFFSDLPFPGVSLQFQGGTPFAATTSTVAIARG